MGDTSFGRFRLKQGGMVVAEVEGDYLKARANIAHYAAVYAQDGPVQIEEHNGKRWRKVP